MTKRTTIRLPGALPSGAKRRVAALRVLPPVSAASGGLMPGIDLNDLAVLQEIEDIELARRLDLPSPPLVSTTRQ